MSKIAIITGSGMYHFSSMKHIEHKMFHSNNDTISYIQGELNNHLLYFIPRHGTKHQRLPHMIPYNSIFTMFAENKVDAIVSTTVVGSLENNRSLGKLIIFDDFFYPQNMYGEGLIATRHREIGSKDRGHLLNPHFDNSIRKQLLKASNLTQTIDKAVYVHQTGPRFSSNAELRFYAHYGDYISQTAGPEVILAGEHQIPYALIGVAIDYATIEKRHESTADSISQNLQRAEGIFSKTLEKFILNFKQTKNEYINYRFEK